MIPAQSIEGEESLSMTKGVVLTLAALALAAPAQAQESPTVDPDHFMTVLKDAGYPAENFSHEKDYRQLLVSKPGSHQFLVEMYDCENGKTCNSMEFFVTFPMDHPPTREAIAAYTGPHEGATLDTDRRGAPRMVMDVFLPDEGLTDAAFLEQVASFETMMTGFNNFLSGKPAAPPPEQTAAAGEAPVAAPAADAS
jgi:hypothetical protein